MKLTSTGLNVTEVSVTDWQTRDLGNTQFKPESGAQGADYSDWVKLTYNVTDAAQPVDIFFSQDLGGGMSFDIANVTDMVVLEGGSRAAAEPAVVTPAYQYTFSSTGEHTVYVKFKDMAIVPDLAFGMCTALVDCKLPNSITMIGDYAFTGCLGLTGILTIPNSVQTIGEVAFAGCTGLTGTLNIPNSVTEIGEMAFGGCTGLTGVTIGEGVQTIREGAFATCTGLTAVTIGSAVQTIEYYAFEECSNLAKITSLATTAPSIESYTFVDIKRGGTLFVPQNATGYDTWMGTDDYYLGYYNWTMQTITE